MQALRGAVSPIWTRVGVVATHGTAFCPCVLADLYWFGINAEYIFGAINGYGYILADFFCKSSRQLASGIELSATDQVGQILLTLIVQTMKKKILAIEAEGLGGNAKSDNLEVRNLGTTPHLGTFPCPLTRFPAKSLQISRILTKFTMKLRISSAIVLSSLVTTNLLIICELCNFSIYIFRNLIQPTSYLNLY